MSSAAPPLGAAAQRAGGVVVIVARGSEGHECAGHPERPGRLSAIVGGLEADDRLSGLMRPAGAPATPETVLLVHSQTHLRAVESLAARGGGWFDADTYCTPRSHAIALEAAGAAVEAIDAVVLGGARAGFALVRPPGHHATAGRAMGFCLLNNAAIAVRHAQRRHGVERVAIIDIDVHHGNGTESIFWEDPSVLYTSLHQHPYYPGTGGAGDRGQGAGDGTTLNVPLPEGTDGGRWLEALEAQVLPAVEAFAPELVVVSAGYDAHVADPLAGLRLETETYRRAAARIAKLSTPRGSVWTLEGGYNLEAMAGSVAASLHGLLEA